MTKAMFQTNAGRCIPFGRPIIKARNTFLFNCAHEVNKTAIDAAGIVLCAECDKDRVRWRKAVREWMSLPPVCIPRTATKRESKLIALKIWEMRHDD